MYPTSAYDWGAHFQTTGYILHFVWGNGWSAGTGLGRAEFKSSLYNDTHLGQFHSAQSTSEDGCRDEMEERITTSAAISSMEKEEIDRSSAAP